MEAHVHIITGVSTRSIDDLVGAAGNA